MLTKPLLTATAQCSRRTEYMTDNFYINGSLPPSGSVPNNKPYSKDLRSKLGIFAVSDGFGSAEEAANAAHKALSILKKYHEKMGSVTVEAVGTVVESYAEEANSFMHSLGGEIGASIAMLVINHGVATAINTGPNAPKVSPRALCTRVAPSISGLKPTPADRHINAVAVQIKSVSMNTESICTRPCLAGWETSAVAAALGAEPIPASLE